MLFAHSRISVVLIAAGVMLFPAACGKREKMPEPTGTFTPITSSWSVDNQTFLPDSVVRSANGIHALGSQSIVSFFFAKLPTVDGVFQIGDPDTDPNKVFVEAFNGGILTSISGQVQVRVAAGKIRIETSDTRMLEMPLPTDTLTLSAHLTER